MIESGLEVSHYFLVVADMCVVIKADKCISLLVDGFYGLFGANEEREHFGIDVRVVGFEVAFADLPGAKQFGRVIAGGTESVG